MTVVTKKLYLPKQYFTKKIYTKEPFYQKIYSQKRVFKTNIFNKKNYQNSIFHQKIFLPKNLARQKSLLEQHFHLTKRNFYQFFFPNQQFYCSKIKVHHNLFFYQQQKISPNHFFSKTVFTKKLVFIEKKNLFNP